MLAIDLKSEKALVAHYQELDAIDHPVPMMLNLKSSMVFTLVHHPRHDPHYLLTDRSKIEYEIHDDPNEAKSSMMR